MGTTAKGLPYPEPTDPVAAGAAAIRELAEAIDTAHIGGGSQVRAAAPVTWTGAAITIMHFAVPGVLPYATRVTANVQFTVASDTGQVVGITGQLNANVGGALATTQATATIAAGDYKGGSFHVSFPVPPDASPEFGVSMLWQGPGPGTIYVAGMGSWERYRA